MPFPDRCGLDKDDFPHDGRERGEAVGVGRAFADQTAPRMAVLTIARQRAGIEGISFTKRTEGSDKRLYFARIGTMGGNAGARQDAQQSGLMPARLGMVLPCPVRLLNSAAVEQCGC